MHYASQVDWGTIPAWISGVLSGASIILALWIIQRDRNKDERTQIARLVIINQQEPKKQGGGRLIVLANTSEQSFYDVACTVHMTEKEPKVPWVPAPTSNQWRKHRMYLRRLKQLVRKGGKDAYVFYSGSDPVHSLEPKAEATARINRASLTTRSRIVITCKDAAGRYWLIDPVTKASMRFEPLVDSVWQLDQ